jgi:hypothetical protein
MKMEQKQKLKVLSVKSMRFEGVWKWLMDQEKKVVRVFQGLSWIVFLQLVIVVEIIKEEHFHCYESLNKVIFSSSPHLKVLHSLKRLDTLFFVDGHHWMNPFSHSRVIWQGFVWRALQIPLSSWNSFMSWKDWIHWFLWKNFIEWNSFFIRQSFQRDFWVSILDIILLNWNSFINWRCHEVSFVWLQISSSDHHCRKMSNEWKWRTSQDQIIFCSWWWWYERMSTSVHLGIVRRLIWMMWFWRLFWMTCFQLN